MSLVNEFIKLSIIKINPGTQEHMKENSVAYMHNRIMEGTRKDELMQFANT